MELDQAHAAAIDEVFQDHASELRAVLKKRRVEQLSWARSIQDSQQRLIEPWHGLFKALGRRPECQEIQVQHVANLLTAARELCAVFDVKSQRALALMFDIKVQSGSIDDDVKSQIEDDFAALQPSGDASADEVARLRIIANRRAEAAKKRWVEDVRTRKLTIANGEGTVHGRNYNLQEQYGISLGPI